MLIAKYRTMNKPTKILTMRLCPSPRIKILTGMIYICHFQLRLVKMLRRPWTWSSSTLWPSMIGALEVAWMVRVTWTAAVTWTRVWLTWPHHPGRGHSGNAIAITTGPERHQKYVFVIADHACLTTYLKYFYTTSFLVSAKFSRLFSVFSSTEKCRV